MSNDELEPRNGESAESGPDDQRFAIESFFSQFESGPALRLPSREEIENYVKRGGSQPTVKRTTVRHDFADDTKDSIIVHLTDNATGDEEQLHLDRNGFRGAFREQFISSKDFDQYKTTFRIGEHEEPVYEIHPAIQIDGAAPTRIGISASGAIVYQRGREAEPEVESDEVRLEKVRAELESMGVTIDAETGTEVFYCTSTKALTDLVENHKPLSRSLISVRFSALEICDNQICLVYSRDDKVYSHPIDATNVPSSFRERFYTPGDVSTWPRSEIAYGGKSISVRKFAEAGGYDFYINDGGAILWMPTRTLGETNPAVDEAVGEEPTRDGLSNDALNRFAELYNALDESKRRIIGEGDDRRSATADEIERPLIFAIRECISGLRSGESIDEWVDFVNDIKEGEETITDRVDFAVGLIPDDEIQHTLRERFGLPEQEEVWPIDDLDRLARIYSTLMPGVQRSEIEEDPRGILANAINLVAQLQLAADRQDVETTVTEEELGGWKRELREICQNLSADQRLELMNSAAEYVVALRHSRETGRIDQAHPVREVPELNQALEIIGPLGPGLEVGEEVLYISPSDLWEWADCLDKPENKGLIINPPRGILSGYTLGGDELVAQISDLTDASDPREGQIGESREQMQHKRRVQQAMSRTKLTADISQAIARERAELKGRGELLTAERAQEIARELINQQSSGEVADIPVADFLRNAVAVSNDRRVTIMLPDSSGRKFACHRLGEQGGYVFGYCDRSGQVLYQKEDDSDAQDKPRTAKRPSWFRRKSRDEELADVLHPLDQAAAASTESAEPTPSDALPVYFKETLRHIGVDPEQLFGISSLEERVRYLSEALATGDPSGPSGGEIRVNASVVELLDVLRDDAASHLGSRKVNLAEKKIWDNLNWLYNYRALGLGAIVGRLKDGVLKSTLHRVISLPNEAHPAEALHTAVVAWREVPADARTNSFAEYIQTAPAADLLSRLAQARLFMARFEADHAETPAGRQGAVGASNELWSEYRSSSDPATYEILVRETIRRCGLMAVSAVLEAGDASAAASGPAEPLPVDQVRQALEAEGSDDKMQAAARESLLLGRAGFFAGYFGAHVARFISRDLHPASHGGKRGPGRVGVVAPAPIIDMNDLVDEEPDLIRDLSAESIAQAATEWVENSPFNTEVDKQLAAHFIRASIAAKLGLWHDNGDGTGRIDEDDWVPVQADDESEQSVLRLKDPKRKGRDLSSVRIIDGQFDFSNLPNATDVSDPLLDMSGMQAWPNYRRDQVLRSLTDDRISEITDMEHDMLSANPDLLDALREETIRVIHLRFHTPPGVLMDEDGRTYMPPSSTTDVLGSIQGYMRVYASDQARKQGIQIIDRSD